jgi:peptide/nickel transport system permease protein
MMIGNGRAVIRTAWYLSAVPGILIVLTVLGVNLLGEALNDAVNARLNN